MPIRVDPAQALIIEEIERVVREMGDALGLLEGRTILITGASGVLPSYMADTVAWLNEHLFTRPCRLFALVHAAPSDGGRLSHLRDRDDVRFLVQNVSDALMITEHIDFYVHAASSASPKKYLAQPLDTMDANVTATRHLLERARREGCEGFLFFSSGEIYGDTPAAHVPTPETFPGLVDDASPRACYTESKRFGETLCMTFHREYAVPVNIVRPFHVYGRGMALDDGRVIADFLRNRIEGTAIRILSDGSGRRAFCYLADATIGFWKSLLCERRGEVYNIGDSREPIAIRDLAQLVARLERPELEVSWAPTLPDHLKDSPSTVCPDIGKATRLLGYAPKTGLEDGLRRTIAWHRARGEKPCS